MPKANSACENQSNASPCFERGAAFATVTALKKHRGQGRKEATHPTKVLPADAAICTVCAKECGDCARPVQRLLPARAV